MNINRVVTILRRVTATVKLMPFVFVLAQLFALVSFVWLDDANTTWLDLALYVSPLVILFEFILSYLLELCIWHRLQCSLPMVPLAIVVVDEHVCQLSQTIAYVNHATLIFLFLSSLLNGYMLFCKH